MLELSRVKQVLVEDLFGLYRHEINLRSKDRVTIIHGPNGVGKTKVLMMLAGLFSGDLSIFGKIPFSKFMVTLEDDSTITIVPEFSETDSGESSTIFPEARARVVDGRGKVLFDDTLSVEKSWTKADEFVNSHCPWLERAGPDLWIDGRDGEEMTWERVVRHILPKIPGHMRRQLLETKPVEFAKEFESHRQRVGVHLIEAQRLLREHTPKSHLPLQTRRALVPTVQDCASNLKEMIREVALRYARESQRLDQNFPARLLKGEAQEKTLSAGKLREGFSDLDKLRKSYMELGVLTKLQQHPLELRELDHLKSNHAEVLTLYLKDTFRKLTVFEDLANRIQLLLHNVNDKKFLNKYVQVDAAEGLVAFDTSSRQLSLESLSSGEQQELVLMYDLLFRVKPNTLVLIDEPELSLHMVWQQCFLDDVLEIAQVANLDLLIATHSPFIVGDRRDLMQTLKADTGAKSVKKRAKKG